MQSLKRVLNKNSAMDNVLKHNNGIDMTSLITLRSSKRATSIKFNLMEVLRDLTSAI
jgi:hypothetical protein